MIYTRKGFAVALKALKPFDCEESNDLVSKAKENYHDIIMWSLELISDYRIRIACGSFSGSFIEYCAHDMSHPVMKTFPQGVSVSPTVTSNEETAVLSHEGEDNVGEQQDTSRNEKRLLPDRSHAAHNRANEKLVNFIVKQRMVEKRLLAIIHGQQQSSWFQHSQRARGKRVVNTYLEDEEQLDKVYLYLKELYANAVATSDDDLGKLKFIDLVAFILDVLLPEAIISAIAGVDNISLQKAEEKFRRGRSISTRERQAFDVMIERYMLSK
uniref:Si:dkey-57k2.7 n=2 Tax=Tetraodon nigroviridis TaxID=99883 RepID=H3DK09_TETNG